MGPLVRLRLRLAGVWTTPWQADSLLGALACAWVRSYGPRALHRDFLKPWLDGVPSFVISDAFPGDSLPAPAILPLWWNWPADQRKKVKQLRWLTFGDFCRTQRGEKPHLDVPPVTVCDHVRLRNAVSRVTDSAGEGGELFEVPFSDLGASETEAYLSIYARVTNDGERVLVEALETLGSTGYGADASVGHGSFEVEPELERCSDLDDVCDANGFVSLSTFQPTARDPVDGFWRSFVKYGKLAPEFHGTAVFKRPQVMLEPGACFRTGEAPKPFYGGSISACRMLSQNAYSSLTKAGVRPVHPAFALSVPILWRDSAACGRVDDRGTGRQPIRCDAQ